MAMIPNVVTVAGVDPSGGAGILADIKTFSALGCYGAAVVTALTAQNTRAVTAVEAVSAPLLRAQLETLLADVRVDAFKLGMLANAELACVVAELLASGAPPLVVDPVMVAKSGDALLAPDAIESLRRRVLPLAAVLTPNLPEAGVLLGREPPRSVGEMGQAALALCALGPRHVLIKGGHLGGRQSPDVLCDGEETRVLEARRVESRNTHGTGCTLSSAIAALLARGRDVPQAAAEAKDFVIQALLASERLSVGGGHGPLHHFHALWPPGSSPAPPE